MAPPAPPPLEIQPDYDADPASPWRDPEPVPAWKRAAYLLSFLVAVLAVDRAVGMAFDQLFAHSQYRYAMLYAGKVEADVAVIGDSRAVHSLFAPEMSERLGVRAWNLSTNGIGMDLISIIVRDYLDRNPPPSTLLVEVTAAEFVPGETLALLQVFFERSARLREAIHQYQPDRYWADLLLHTYHYNGSEAMKPLIYLGRDDQHWISPAARKIPASFLEHREIGGGELKADPRQVAAWGEVVAAARAKGVRLVPFIAPYLRGALGDRDILKEYERAFATVPDAPPILDYSRAVDADDAFVDRGHANELGAHLLLDRMIADGVFAGVSRVPAGR